MDRLGRRIVDADELLWYGSNVSTGLAVFIATLVYAPPGTHALDIGVVNLDPFYLLVPLSIGYMLWTGRDLYRWITEG